MTTAQLQNITYDELEIGQTADYSRMLTEEQIALFAAASGDINPVHMDARYAASTAMGERIGHGAWVGGLVSAAIGLKLPGPGTIYVSQELSFKHPVKLDDNITVALEVIDKVDRIKKVTIACVASNQDGKVVAKGVAQVIAPTEKLSLAAPALPTIDVQL